jgi:hypothetical protein
LSRKIHIVNLFDICIFPPVTRPAPCRRLAERDGPMRVGMSEHRLASRMRHEGCGGRAGRVELLTGIDGVSSRPVRKIVLIAG